eukprot:6489762-Amphidinium_carterae.1
MEYGFVRTASSEVWQVRDAPTTLGHSVVPARSSPTRRVGPIGHTYHSVPKSHRAVCSTWWQLEGGM